MIIESFWENQTFIALDIETTGLDFKKSEIIEIGAAIFINGKLDKTFSCVIKPQGVVPNFIKQLTGISDTELNNGISPRKALKDLLSFLGSHQVVCHNSSFDIDFIQYHLSLLNLPLLSNPINDTLELSKIYLPFLANHKLETVTRGLQIEDIINDLNRYSDEQLKAKKSSASTSNSTASKSEDKIPLKNVVEITSQPKKYHRALYDAIAAGVIYLHLTDFIIRFIPLNLNILVQDIAIQSIEGDSLENFLHRIVTYQRQNALINDFRDKLTIDSPLAETLGFNRSHNVIVSESIEESFKEDEDTLFQEYPDQSFSSMQETLPPDDIPTDSDSLSLKDKTLTEDDPDDETLINKCFDLGGYIQQQFPSYEYREGQVLMAKAVRKALFNKDYLMVEAGTGIGKTFAYLVPAIEFSHKKDVRVFISTNTKNLQEQFFFKDLPVIKECLPIPFRAAILKGRDNYLCLRKWNEAVNFNKNQLTEYESSALLHLLVWQYYTRTGDVSENSSFQNASDTGSVSLYATFWRKLINDRYFCQRRYCSQASRCFYHTIRQKAEMSHIIVTNHYLILSDLINERFNNEDNNYLIIDEAHNLPELASKCLGFSLSYSDFNHFFNQLFSIRKKLQAGTLANLKADVQKSVIEDAKKVMLHSEIENLIDTIENNRIYFDTFFQSVADIVAKEGSFGKLRIKEQQLKRLLKSLQELISICIDIHKRIYNLSQVLLTVNKNNIANYDNHEDKINGSIEKIKELTEALKTLKDPDWDNHAYWISSFYTNDPLYPSGVVNYAPLDVSKILQTTLYQQINSLIFTSATLALRNSFKFFATRTGIDTLDKNVSELIVPSPFDYHKQTKVIAPEFLPIPSDNYFQAQSIDLLKRTLVKVKAGSMVLFTSYKDLNTAYDELSPILYEKNILLLAQGKGFSRTAILNEFKLNGKAVLLGTSSFWEGIDVPGDSLSLLILYKLPFQVPSEPIVEAFYDKLRNENKDPFMYATLPNAMLKFRQGFGRLIRNHTDKGAVLVLDSRILNKKYGAYFREIIPTNIQRIKTPIEIEDIISWWLK